MWAYLAPSAVTITLANLASNAARESLLIDNRTLKCDDYALQLSLGVNAGTAAGDELACYIYFAACYDGTNWTEPCTGADAAVVLGTDRKLFGPWVVPVCNGGTMYDCMVPSIAMIFGGVVPPQWSFVIDNQVNGGLCATEASFIKYLVGIYATA